MSTALETLRKLTEPKALTRIQKAVDKANQSSDQYFQAEQAEAELVEKKQPKSIDYIRSEHEVGEFQQAAFKKAMALVAGTVIGQVKSLKLTATIDGKDISLEYRVGRRSKNEFVNYILGHYEARQNDWGEYNHFVHDENFEAESKTYQGRLKRFKTRVRVDSFTPDKAEAAKQAIEALFA